jgi:DNA repair protein RadD
VSPLDPWPFQAAGISRAREAFRQGARRIVLVSPTGSGKSFIGATIVRLGVEKCRRPLWLVGGRDLVAQAHRELLRAGLKAGIIMAGVEPSDGQVQVASVDTLLARGYRPPADLIVFDECSHAVADGAASLLKDYPSAHVVGLDAVPERSDGRGLGEIFDRLIVVAQVRKLVEAGYLTPCRIIAPADQLKPRQIAQRAVDAHREYAAGTPTIVFSSTVKRAYAAVEDFKSVGIEAQVIEAHTEWSARQRFLAGFASGDIPVLVNVGTLTEGTDLPIAATAILERKVDSFRLFTQIIGRIRRRFTGKQQCLVLDLHGSVHIHGHPDEERTYSLEGVGIRRAAAAADTWCRVCGCPIEPGAICPDCGTGPRAPKPVKITEDPLVKYEKLLARPADSRTLKLANWLREGAAKGWKPRAAQFKFRAAFGYFPHKGMMLKAKQEMEKS